MSDNGKGMTFDDIVPLPAPWAYDVRRGHTDDTALIRFEIRTYAGSTVVFMPPDYAHQVAQSLLQASSGIEIAKQVPPSSRYTPPGQN